jgi:hypothetical protein
MTLFSVFLLFIYEQIITQMTEQILHEAIICDATLGEGGCLIQATSKANASNFLATVLVVKNRNAYVATIFIRGTWKWKTIMIENTKVIQKPNTRVLSWFG